MHVCDAENCCGRKCYIKAVGASAIFSAWQYLAWHRTTGLAIANSQMPCLFELKKINKSLNTVTKSFLNSFSSSSFFVKTLAPLGSFFSSEHLLLKPVLQQTEVFMDVTEPKKDMTVGLVGLMRWIKFEEQSHLAANKSLFRGREGVSEWDEC